jgi:hypothetical protein
MPIISRTLSRDKANDFEFVEEKGNAFGFVKDKGIASSFVKDKGNDFGFVKDKPRAHEKSLKLKQSLITSFTTKY